MEELTNQTFPMICRVLSQAAESYHLYIFLFLSPFRGKEKKYCPRIPRSRQWCHNEQVVQNLFGIKGEPMEKRHEEDNKCQVAHKQSKLESNIFLPHPFI
uniref:Uncharacterized protein n=1 Tax=Crocodylus porosus TaxID=8502 RepID=A0A7M4E370_CROPO